MKNRRGSITILLLIIFPVILGSGLFFASHMRQRAAVRLLEQALIASGRSLLAGYDRETFREYGLLTLPEGNNDFLREMVEANMDESALVSLDLLEARWEPVQWLDQDQVLKNQILESVKYSGPYHLGRALMDLFQNFTQARKLSEAGEKAVKLEQARENMDRVEGNNRKVKNFQEDIRNLNQEIRREKGKENPDPGRIVRLEQSVQTRRGQIDDLYGENRSLVMEVQDLLDQTGETSIPAEDYPEGFSPRQFFSRELDNLQQARRRLGEKTGQGDLDRNLPEEKDRKLPEGAGGEALGIFRQIQNLVTEGRNELYLGEYVVQYFSHLNQEKPGRDFPRQEAEYVITGSDSPHTSYLLRLMTFRSAVNSVAYFAFSRPPAPAGPISRLAYSLLMGVWEGALDIFRMVGREDAVSVVSMMPSTSNPLRNLKLDYEDHLRISLMLVDREEKLDRIRRTVSPEGITGVRIRVRARLGALYPSVRPGDGKILEREMVICY